MLMFQDNAGRLEGIGQLDRNTLIGIVRLLAATHGMSAKWLNDDHRTQVMVFNTIEPAVKVEVQTDWNPNLFLRVEDVAWGQGQPPHCATRLMRALSGAGITFVAETLLIYCWHSSYTIMRKELPEGGSRIITWDKFRHYEEGVTLHGIKGYGHKSHKLLLEALRDLGIDPNMDLTDFPWDQLPRV